MAPFLIVTADDFGLSEQVNEAVERACRHGILTAASLMVCAPAAADAVKRARTLPRLSVGLHLVLVDGVGALAPPLTPVLHDRDGVMDCSMLEKSLRFVISAAARRQLRAEITAQFAAFAATGLTLDHVNLHKHFHFHPIILEIVLQVGREFGLKALRVPDEPLGFAMQSGWVEGLKNAALRPWVTRMKKRLRSAEVLCNDRIFGIAKTGSMNEASLLDALARLHCGISEIYLHPATESNTSVPSMQGYRHSEELAALLSPRVIAKVGALHIARGGFGAAQRSLEECPA